MAARKGTAWQTVSEATTETLCHFGGGNDPAQTRELIWTMFECSGLSLDRFVRAMGQAWKVTQASGEGIHGFIESLHGEALADVRRAMIAANG